jgi:hypothetical protein
MTEITTAVRPLRDLVYVEKIVQTHSPSGLIELPGTFRAGKGGHSARLKMGAVQDTFHARVLSIGPNVRELSPGDEVLVFTFAEGDGSTLWTGENVGERNRMMVKYPDDILCALDTEDASFLREEPAEAYELPVDPIPDQQFTIKL